MRRMFAALLIALLPGAGFAEETPLTKLMTAYQANGWEGVGRVNIGRGGMCTGALIAPRLVLTAAHCLFDPYTGRKVAANEVRFLAGWRNGSASAYRGVRRAIPHPEYEHGKADDDYRVSHDVALLELDSEIRLSNVRPFEIAPRPRKGADVGVVSYAHDRRDQPSLQEVCHVLGRRAGTLVVSCNVDFGSSGAPIFIFENGKPRIVSVVSAKAQVGENMVALGTSLEKPLADLKAILGRSDGLSARRITPSTGTGLARMSKRPGSQGGAKFVKP